MSGKAAGAGALAATTLSLALAPVLPVAGAAPATQPDAAKRTVTTRLSDEQRLSRWAYPARRASIRTAPSTSGRTIAQLRLQTEDGLPETYLLLDRREGPGGQDWVRLRIPARPNGRTGWVPRDALGDFHQVRTALLVDRKRLRVTVRRSGKLVASFPIGIGKRGTPTPAGRFWIREKFQIAAVGGVYGPRALGTSAYAPYLTDWPNGGVVGFHGTNQPGLVPGRPSHGCIRLRNGDIMRLYRLVPVGTPVHVV